MVPARPPLVPDLYVILDRAAARGRDLGEILAGAIAGGCRMVQLREKERPSGTLLPLAERLRARCREAGVAFVVNDRVDLALALDADGVHLGQEDLPPRLARPLLRAGMILGVSTHSIEQACAAPTTWPWAPSSRRRPRRASSWWASTWCGRPARRSGRR